MTISAEIQNLIDQVHANTSLEQSADIALKAIQAQVADLGTQIAALQLQIANGGSLHPDDIAALAAAQQELADSAQKLRADIPANTSPEPVATPEPVPAPAPAPANDPTGETPAA